MKKVISISLGSSSRNHKVQTEILGMNIEIERIGTDGDIDKAVELIKKLDGEVDAFGLGGTDLYICVGNKRYLIRDAYKLANAAVKTPIVDGSGLKNTLERKTVRYLREQDIVDLRKKKVLLVCAMDRFGMAESFEESGAEMIYGDLMFALGIPIPIYSLKALGRIARMIAPLVCQLPFKYIYPTGKKQDEAEGDGDKIRFEEYYYNADIIAGDYHYIKKHLPNKLPGKIILTNTVTKSDVEKLRMLGVDKLMTTTPNLNGRSFGTNVMEAVLVTVAGKKPEEMTVGDYEKILDEMKFKPRIECLQQEEGVLVNG